VAILLVIGVIALIGAILRALLSSPQAIGHFLGARRRDRGYRALTRGMVAVGAGDVKAARRAAQESRSLLGAEPLVLLLSAQAAQIAGDGTAARDAFEALSATADTRLLGLHGLFVEARRQGEHAAARHFAEEAVKLAPQTAWAGTALFDYQSQSGDFSGALKTLGVNASARIVDKARARRLRAVLDTGRALELEGGDPDEARALAMEAHKLAPDLVPAAAVAARLFARAGEIRRASRIIEATWRIEPHPELAETYALVRSGDSATDRLKRVQRLVTLHPGHPESAMALARAAIDARDWPAARQALGGIMRVNPSERVCLLMAEIEEGEHGDQGRVRGWLTRALTAPRDAAWMADGQVFERWAPVSPISGQIDAFAWRVPPERPVTRALEIEADADEAATTPPAAPAPAPAGGTVARGAVEPATAAVRLPGAGVGAGAGLGGAKPAAGPRPLARAPDDPGPPDDDEVGEDAGGFRLFRGGGAA
jgi:HemY protein